MRCSDVLFLESNIHEQGCHNFVSSFAVRMKRAAADPALDRAATGIDSSKVIKVNYRMKGAGVLLGPLDS